MERIKNAYLEMMNKYGFSVTKMIAQEIIRNLWTNGLNVCWMIIPDAQAIVFANDEMARGYRVCGKRGLQVGERYYDHWL